MIEMIGIKIAYKVENPEFKLAGDEIRITILSSMQEIMISSRPDT